MTHPESNRVVLSGRRSGRRWDLRGVLQWTFAVGALLYCTVKLLLLGLAAINVEYVMDEYWQGGFSIFIPDGFYTGIDPIKNVLYVYFYQISRLLSDDAVSLMLIARVQSFLLALGMVVFAAATARNLGRSRTEVLLTIVVLLSFSNFMERSFRVRGDTLAAFFACIALWMATRARHRALDPLATGLLAGLAFLATQKSIYVAAALGAAFLVAALLPRDRFALVRQVGLFCFGWVSVLMAYAVYFGGLEFYRVLGMVFLSPVEVAFESDNFYPDIGQFVLQTLERNQLAYGLCFVGLVLAVVGMRRSSSANRIAGVATVVLSFFVFSHNQPWPYVFVVVLPFLCHWSVETIRKIPRIQDATRLWLMLVVLAVLATSLPRNLGYLTRSNAAQNEVVREAESYLHPADRYCDGLGMITTRRWACTDWWDATNVARTRERAKSGDMSSIEEIFERQPKVWILNYRVRALWPLLEDHMIHSYARIQPNILLSGVKVRPGEKTTFTNWWPGLYSLFSGSGEKVGVTLLVDGEIAGKEIELARRQYQLSLPADAGDTALFLFPSDTKFDGELPVTEPARDLFNGVYD